jgi:hypothetical protein
MKTDVFYPELGQTTDATIEAKLAHGGGMYLTTDLDLKGRGIRQSGDGSDHKRGKKTYIVTERAYEKLKTQHSTAVVCML